MKNIQNFPLKIDDLSNDLVERSIINDLRILPVMIDFSKYLNCPDCKDAGVYCDEHRVEVEKILKENDFDLDNN